jgi:hypothetical protein
MPLGDGIICPYCGNPSPNYKRRMKGTAGMKFNAGSPEGSFGGEGALGYEGVNQTAPLVTCTLCDRKFYLFALSHHKDYCKRFLKRTLFHDTVYENMKHYHLSYSDIIDGFEGITQVKSFTSCINDIKKKIYYGDEIHLVFSKDSKTYFMTINNSARTYQAVNLGVA